jgi:LPS-assembly protein
MFPLRPHLFICIALMGIFLLTGISAGYSASPKTAPKSDKNFSLPVKFSAKSLAHDDEKQTVTAIGDVELIQGPQILRADKMVYYLNEDKVTAIGNVSLLDEKGDVHFSEYAELHDQMKDGFIQGLLSMLADGSRFTAATAKREGNGTKTTMTDATYTTCKVCENDPHPLWQIKASQITHNTEDKSIDYKGAWMEVMGVPVIYTPIFSHPDPTETQKSGLLRPQYGWSTDMGTHAEAGYYWAIAPDKDATFQVEPTTLAGTLLKGEWRERFSNGEMKIDANTVNSDRNVATGSIGDDRQRGSIFGDGLFDINNEWRTGFDVQRASDKQYLSFYDLYNNDPTESGLKNNGVLNSDVYAERFAGRDYSLISAMSFQNLSLTAVPDQPDILPIAEHSMLGEPNGMWGGRWDFNTSVLELLRNPDDQNVQRGSLDAGWERRGTSSSGFSNIVALDARSDFYSVQNNYASATPGVNANPTTARPMATATAITSYPLIKAMDHAQAIIEPIAGVNFSPDVSNKDNIIPNEDSQDIQLDVDNLFQPNRYPGIDRQEDGGRLNYGLKTSLYGDDGKFGKVFMGESYRLYGNSYYPDGTGLVTRRSDYVGQLKLGLNRYLDADYRVQLDPDTFAARRHEIQGGAGNDDFRINTHYFLVKPVDGLTPLTTTTAVEAQDFDTTRQQLETDGTYNLTKSWKVHAAELVDLGNEPGLRNANAGIMYSNECFTFGIQGARNLAATESGANETQLTFQIIFKGLGEYSPGIGLGKTTPTTTSTTQ